MKKVMKKIAIYSAVAALVAFAAAEACTKIDTDEANGLKTINTKVELVGSIGTKAGNQTATPEITPEQREYIINYFANNADKDLGKTAIPFKNFRVLNVIKGKDKTTGKGLGMNHLFVDYDPALGNANPKYIHGNVDTKEVYADIKDKNAIFSYFCTDGEGSGNNVKDKYIVLMIDGVYYIGFDYEYYDKKTKTWHSDDVYTDWILRITENTPEVDPTDPEQPETVDGEVEFDVHQQEHKDWKEVKTSIHIRATVDAKIIIPIPAEYQAQADDFAIRAGVEYEYITKQVKIGDKTYDINFDVEHAAEGIIITVGTSEASEAINAALQLYEDGITFEVHTYAINDITDEQLWGYLKQTKCLQTKIDTDADFTDVQACNVRGQVTSAFFPEKIYFDQKAGKVANE